MIAIFNNNEKKAGKETKFDFERGRKNTTSSHILILPLILIENYYSRYSRQNIINQTFGRLTHKRVPNLQLVWA